MKLNKIKSRLLPILALIACIMFTAFFGLNYNFSASATTDADTNVFVVDEIASVYVNPNEVKDVRIRFGVKIGYDFFDKNKANDNDGNDETLAVEISINKENHDVAADARVIKLSVQESDFGGEDKIISLSGGIKFNAATEGRLQEATAMRLKADVYVPAETPITADKSGLVQDMRSVASYWIAEGTLEGAEGLSEYVGNHSTVTSDTVSPLAAGTVSGTIDFASDEWTAFVAGKDVSALSIYVNSNLVSGASVTEAGVVTIPQAALESLRTVNFVQIFDSENNVIVKEFTDEIPVYNGGEAVCFSAMDGELPVEAVFGAGATLSAVKVVESDYALADGETLTTALTIETDGTVTGLQTKRTEFTNATLVLSTETASVKVNVKAATKVIDEASDLEVFMMSPDKAFTLEGDTRTVCAIDGYYPMVCDIDATSVTLNHDLSSDVNVFVGVFDGQGYSLTFNTVGGGLFYKIGQKAVIKNAALYAVLGTTSSTSILSEDLLIYNTDVVQSKYGLRSANPAYLTDLYIKTLNDYTYFNGVTGRTHNGLNWNRVVVDLSSVTYDPGIDPNDLSTITVSTGIMSYVASVNEHNGDDNYMISATLPLVARPVTLRYVAAENEIYVPDTDYEGYSNTEDNKTYYLYQGVRKYDSVAEMKADTENDYTVFDSAIWSTNYGTPVIGNARLTINGAAINHVELTEKGTATVTVSGADANSVSVTVMDTSIVSVEDNVITCTSKSSGSTYAVVTYTVDGVSYTEYATVMVKEFPVTEYNTEDNRYEFSVLDGDLPDDLGIDLTASGVTAFDADGNELTVADGKVQGFKMNRPTIKYTTVEYSDARDQVTESYINVFDATHGVKIYITAYTMIIDEASDFDIFDLNSERASAAAISDRYISGYYVLKNDILDYDGTSYHSAVKTNGSTVSADFGFAGVFDGRGYTVKGTLPKSGMFGVVCGLSIIKNVKLDMTVQSNGAATLGYLGGYTSPYSSAGSRPNFVINVHATVSGTTSAAFHGVSWVSTANFNLQNTVFDLSNLTANGFAISRDASVKNTGSASYKNVFLTTMPFSPAASSCTRAAACTHYYGEIDSGFDTSVTTNAKGYTVTWKKLTGYERRDSLTALAQAYTTQEAAETAFAKLTATGYWEIQALKDGETVIGYIPVWVGNTASAA